MVHFSIDTEPVIELRLESLSSGPQSITSFTFHTTCISCTNELLNRIMLSTSSGAYCYCVLPEGWALSFHLHVWSDSPTPTLYLESGLTSNRLPIKICSMEQLLLIIFLLCTTLVLQLLRKWYLQELLLTLHLGGNQMFPFPRYFI